MWREASEKRLDTHSFDGRGNKRGCVVLIDVLLVLVVGGHLIRHTFQCNENEGVNHVKWSEVVLGNTIHVLRDGGD